MLFKKKKEVQQEASNETVRVLRNIGYEPLGKLNNYIYDWAQDMFGETKHRHPKVAVFAYNFDATKPRHKMEVSVYTCTGDPDINHRLGGKEFKIADYCFEEVREEATKKHIYDLIDESDIYGFNLGGLLEDIYDYIRETSGEIKSEGLELFYSDDVTESRKHIIWYGDKKQCAEGKFKDGKIIIVAEGTNKFQICSYNSTENYTIRVGDGETTPQSIMDNILHNDTVLKEILNDTHGTYYSRVEELKKWCAYYVEEERTPVFLGEFKSPYLDECIAELKDYNEHIPDLIEIQKDW